MQREVRNGAFVLLMYAAYMTAIPHTKEEATILGAMINRVMVGKVEKKKRELNHPQINQFGTHSRPLYEPI